MNGYALYLIWGFASDLLLCFFLSKRGEVEPCTLSGGRVFEVGRDINFLLES